MHNTFRTIGQQMGLQINRAILPESIDVYLNGVIMEKIRLELINSVSVSSEKNANTKAQVMTAINNFRTLFYTTRFKLDIANIGINKKVAYYDSSNSYYVINIPTIKSNIDIDSDEHKINPLLYLDFFITYKNNPNLPISCRLISNDAIEETLRDYCNTASVEYPIICVNNLIENNGNTNQLELFINGNKKEIDRIGIKYIKVPNVVKLADDEEDNIDCDLPEYLHYEIVERAVNKFYQSMGYSSNNDNT